VYTGHPCGKFWHTTALLTGSLTSSRHCVTTPAAVSRLQVGTQEFFEIVSGVRQDCILSPFLFIIVIDFVMRRTMDNSKYGIVWQKRNRLTDLDFADDIAIVVEEENVCQEMTTKLEERSAQVGLNISWEKNDGHGNHPSLITTANSHCIRKHRICTEIHLPGKCNI